MPAKKKEEAVETKAEKKVVKVKKELAKPAAKVKKELAKPAAKVKKELAKPAAKKAEKAGVPAIEIQSPMGGSVTPAEIIAKVPKNTANVYVRIDQNKLYYVLKSGETGSVEIWE